MVEKELGSEFTSAEWEGLTRLARTYKTQHLPGEMGLDPAQVGFAKWLVQHGKVSEQPKPGEDMTVSRSNIPTVVTLEGVVSAKPPAGRPRSQFEMRGGTPPRRDCTR